MRLYVPIETSDGYPVETSDGYPLYSYVTVAGFDFPLTCVISARVLTAVIDQ